jgi:predicted AlkP superfamily phosphohydrolase/phosphomutase
LVWAGVSLLLLQGCGAPQDKPRVLLVGIDGAAPDVTKQWIEEGLLSNLGEIARTGVSGQLKSHHPLLSPRVWTSIATGKIPAKHGIENWIREDESGKPRLFTSADRKVHALWNIASESGLTVGVVGWLMTNPVEKVTGVLISEFALPDEQKLHEGLGGQFARARFGEPLPVQTAQNPDVTLTYPESWAQTVERLDAQNEPLVDIRNPFIENAPLTKKIYHRMLARTFRNENLQVRLSLEIIHTVDPDILMLILPGIDRVSHSFWGALESDEVYPQRLRFPPPAKKAAAQAMRTQYQYVDRLIGKLLEEFGGDDLVIVVSDHGFAPLVQEGSSRTGGHETREAENGVIFARGPGIIPGTTVEGVSVNDITPTILAWLGLPLAQDMDGHPASFLQVKLAEPVPTYDISPIERLGDVPEEVEEATIDRLRALGYVD